MMPRCQWRSTPTRIPVRRPWAWVAAVLVATLTACTGDEAKEVGFEICATVTGDAMTPGTDLALTRRHQGLASAAPSGPGRHLVWLWRSAAGNETASPAVPVPTGAEQRPICARLSPPSPAMASRLTAEAGGRMTLLLRDDPERSQVTLTGHAPWAVLFDDLDADGEFSTETDRLLGWSTGLVGTNSDRTGHGLFWLHGFEAALRDRPVERALRPALPHPSAPFVNASFGLVSARWTAPAIALSNAQAGCGHIIARPECAHSRHAEHPLYTHRRMVHLDVGAQAVLDGWPGAASGFEDLRTRGLLGTLDVSAPAWWVRAPSESIFGEAAIQCAQAGAMEVLHVEVLTRPLRISDPGAWRSGNPFEALDDFENSTLPAARCRCQRDLVDAFAIARKAALPAWWPCASIATAPLSGVIGVLGLPGDFQFLWQLLISGETNTLELPPRPAEGPTDAGLPEAGLADSGIEDAGVPDAERADAAADAEARDAERPDAAIDTGPTDAGLGDLSPPDTEAPGNRP